MTTLLLAVCIALVIVTIIGTIVLFLFMRAMILEISESVSDMSDAISGIAEQLKELGITE